MYPIDFVRTARAMALAKCLGVPIREMTRKLYGETLEQRHIHALTTHEPITKAVVDSLGTVDLATYSRASAEFVDSVRPLEVLGRLQGYLRAPFLTPLPYISVATQFDFVGERQQIPVVAPDFGDNVFLPRTRISGIVVTSKDLLEYAPSGEAVLFRELSRGVVEASDRRLLDPQSSEIAGQRPASITFGAPTLDAAGAATPADVDGVIGDLLQVLITFGSRLDRAALVTTTEICTALSLMRDASGARAYPGLTVNGGELAGLPLLASAAGPADTLIAVDASELLVADEGQARLDTSTHATVNQDDDSSGTNAVGMFQTESVAIKVLRYVNWRMRNTGFVAYASNFSPPMPAWASGGAA